MPSVLAGRHPECITRTPAPLHAPIRRMATPRMHPRQTSVAPFRESGPQPPLFAPGHRAIIGRQFAAPVDPSGRTVTEQLALAKPEQPLRIDVGSATHVGGRPENEDAVHMSQLPPVGTGPDAAEGG